MKDAELSQMCRSDDAKKTSSAFLTLLVKEVLLQVLSVPIHIR